VGAFCASTAPAGSMRACILRRGRGEAIRVEHRELRHRLPPRADRRGPPTCDVSQRQPDQFRRRVVAGEMPTRRDDFAELRVDALEAVGRVNDASDLRRKREKGDHVRPGARPRRDDGRQLRAPGFARDVVKRGGRGLGAPGGNRSGAGPSPALSALSNWRSRDCGGSGARGRFAGWSRERRPRAPRSCP
jgi:hypothetical protein